MKCVSRAPLSEQTPQPPLQRRARHPRLLALALSAGLLACGGAAPPEADPAEFREPGLYEITIRFGDLSHLGLPPEAEAEVMDRLRRTSPRRECLLGGRPAVGGPFLDGRCRYTRVADRGTAADRSVACPAEGGSVDTLELTGTTRKDGYALRILTRRSDAATGRVRSEVESFETARRIGPCPE
jgi:hypothetical protein